MPNFHNNFLKFIAKLCLNLAILAGLGILVWHGYHLFTHQVDALSGSISLIIGIAIWITIIRLSKSRSRNYWLRYKGTKPSFKLTTFSTIAILLILTFAGCQPFAGYKDSLIERWETYWTKQEVERVEREAEAAVVRAEREAKAEEETRQREESRKAEEEQRQAELNQTYTQLFNEFRLKNGLPPLTSNARLNELAKQRAIEISQPGNFNHSGIEKYNLGENIAMMAYSTSSNLSLLELWASSPGHRANMLSPSYTRTGFARVGRYAVQLFDF